MWCVHVSGSGGAWSGGGGGGGTLHVCAHIRLEVVEHVGRSLLCRVS